MTRLASRLAAAAALACVCGAVDAAPRWRSGAPPRSPGKPTAPLTIEVAPAAEPAVGALLEIAVEVRAPAEVRDLTLDVRAADGEALLVAAVAPVTGRPGAWTVTVVPLADGTSYLSVTAQGTIGGAPQARSVAIPVRAGAGEKGRARPLAAQRVSLDERDGEPVVLLPAAESARPAPR